MLEVTQITCSQWMLDNKESFRLCADVKQMTDQAALKAFTTVVSDHHTNSNVKVQRTEAG